MDKKGIYSPTLVIFVIFLLAYSIFTFLGNDLNFYGIAGKNQVKLIETYNKGEFIRQYIKQSARNSINNGLFEMKRCIFTLFMHHNWTIFVLAVEEILCSRYTCSLRQYSTLR